MRSGSAATARRTEQDLLPLYEIGARSPAQRAYLLGVCARGGAYACATVGVHDLRGVPGWPRSHATRRRPLVAAHRRVRSSVVRAVPHRPLALALLALGCARPHAAPDVAAAPRAAPPPPAAPVAARVATPAALSPLFARKARCVGPEVARSLARRARVDGGVVARVLTRDEVLARPWLWGQYPSGCAGVGWAPPGADAGAADRAVTEGTPQARALAVADAYLAWGRVDDYQRWAPFDCMLPPASAPQGDLGARAPHGRKVYYLYALDRAAYLEHRDVQRQVVVKEAWAPEEVPVDEAISAGYSAQCAAQHDGRCVQPGEFRGLFVMMRGEATPDTDAGWTYATVDPRGEVTASGRVAQCMGCHEDAPHGRLFGIASGAQVRWH